MYTCCRDEMYLVRGKAREDAWTKVVRVASLVDPFVEFHR